MQSAWKYEQDEKSGIYFSDLRNISMVTLLLHISMQFLQIFPFLQTAITAL